MAREGYTAVSSLLRSDEAEMLCGLLRSAAIEVIVEGEGVAPLGLPSTLLGASILVPDRDAERAREIVGASGVFAGEPRDAAAEIDEAEWRAGADARRVQEPPARREQDPASLASSALTWASAALPLCFTLVVPLIAVWTVDRAWRGTPPASRTMRLRLTGLLAVLSVLGGVLFWAEIAPALAPRRTPRVIDLGGGRSLPLPEPPPRRPFP